MEDILKYMISKLNEEKSDPEDIDFGHEGERGRRLPIDWGDMTEETVKIKVKKKFFDILKEAVDESDALNDGIVDLRDELGLHTDVDSNIDFMMNYFYELLESFRVNNQMEEDND